MRDRICDLKIFLPLVILLVPLWLLLRNPTGFPYPSAESIYSDFSISHYPNARYLKAQIIDHRTVPLWSPLILSGYPFSANPLSGLWYPPGWLALFFPLPLGLNLVAAMHILWGGFGVFYLLRSEGLSRVSAVFGAVAFESMPKIIAHYGAGHLTLLFAISWTPWLFYSTRRSIEKGELWKWSPSVVLGLICLADPRWVVFAGIWWVCYSLANRISFVRDQVNQGGGDGKKKLRILLQKIFSSFSRIFLQAFLAFMLACPMLLPLMEYTNLSTRIKMIPEDTLQFSLPPGRLLGMVYPEFGGNHEYMVYLGGSVFLLSMVSLLRKHKSSSEKFWWWSAFVSMIFALGSNSPFGTIAANLPGFNLLRVPSRGFFITSISLSFVAAYTIDFICRSKKIHNLARITLPITAITGLILFMGMGMGLIVEEVPVPFIYGGILIVIEGLLIGIKLVTNHRQHRVGKSKLLRTSETVLKNSCLYWYLAILMLALLDWGFVNASLLSFRSKTDVLLEGSQVSRFLSSHEGVYRVYSPSYSIPQEAAVSYGLELADGVDPLHLEAYSKFMQEATGVPIQGYSVTVPPFVDGNPSFDNVLYSPNARLLGFLNVGFVAAEFDLSVDGLDFIKQIGTTRVYANRWKLPRAWVQEEKASLGTDIIPASFTRIGPNRINVTASGPGLLVLSEIYYPGWIARMDGEPVEIVRVFNVLRGVPLTSGDHQVTFIFQPISVYLGIGIFSLGILFLLIYILTQSNSKPS